MLSGLQRAVMTNNFFHCQYCKGEGCPICCKFTIGFFISDTQYLYQELHPGLCQPKPKKHYENNVLDFEEWKKKVRA